MSIRSILTLGFVAVVSVAVIPRQGAVTILTSAQVNAFTTYTYYTSKGYCSPTTTINWPCGSNKKNSGWYAALTSIPPTNCNQNPKFLPTASGGDGTTIPHYTLLLHPITLGVSLLFNSSQRVRGI